ncbi:AMMECR1 domain-containing protein [Meloidogyne graminicola]|uniref:AMMECR1 domain-containing protein n=1 Tax=Meloidogyne graminicola TaxID=189291 RepID=A0A8S9ZBC3_9BILA|nr:AMMECR1 domain-containing protein [Meloidogyne graminicola]
MTRQNDSLLNRTNNSAANDSNTSQQVTNAVVPNNGGKIATIDMPVHCFDVVIAHLSKNKLPKCPTNVPNEKFPLFVTWKKGHQRQLRGCIGTFSKNLPLHEGLSEYAHTSAFRDSRFDPIALHEMPHLHCAVSLLVCFEPARHYRDWLIGIHGIRIEYRQHHRSMSAVYLPEVAIDQGWNHIETVNNLMRKGGFKGEITEVDRQAVLVERFQSEKMSISYEEYLTYKKYQQHRNGEMTTLDGSGGSANGGPRNGLLCNGFLNSCLP